MDSYESDNDSFSNESFSDELSPTDGYFNPRNDSYETHFEASSSSDNKAIEAAQTLQEPAVSSPLTRGRRTMGSYAFSESSPLLDVGPPPPAYSAAIASPPAAASNRSNDHENAGPSTNYGGTTTIIPFDTTRIPESMAEPVEIEDGQLETLWHRRRRRSRPFGQLYRKILHILIATIGIVLMILILVLVFTGSWSKTDEEGHPHATLPTIPGPVKGVPGKDIPGKGVPPTDCPYTAHAQERTFTFSEPEVFSLQEFIDDDDLIPGGVSGIIRIVPGPSNQQHNIEVRLSFRTSDHYSVKQIRYAVTDTSLSIKTPALEQTKRTGFGYPCLGISATISIAPGVLLENLQVNTANFDLDLPSGVDVLISNTTDITLVRGSLSSAHFDSRKTIIDVVSGSVKGVFALRDLLSVTTKSGTIDVSVDPKNASEIYPAPAESFFHSTDGSITVGFPTAKSRSNEANNGPIPGLWYSGSVPDRDFRTHVTSNSGSIHGIFLHGSSTKMRSTSGSITASIHPLHASSETTTISTESEASHQAVHISAPLFEPEAPMRHLSSSHRSTAGSIQLEYPQTWEGKIRGVRGSGQVSLKGKDVEILEDVDRRLLARKGYGQSELSFQSTAGSVQMVVGDV